MFRASQHKEAAWQLIEYLSRPEIAAALPRTHRRPAAAAQRLARRPRSGRRSVRARLSRAARARQARRRRCPSGSTSPPRCGWWPSSWCNGKLDVDAGRHRAGPPRRRDPGEAALDARPGGGEMSTGSAPGRLGVRRAGAAGDRACSSRCRCWPALALSVTDFDIYALADLDNLRFVGLENYVRAAAQRRCSGRRSATRSTSWCVGGPLSIAVSLGAALLLNSKLGALQAVLPHRALRAGGDHLVAVAVVWRYLFHTALRPGELRAWRRRHRRRSTGWAIRTGRCRRSSCSRCGRTSATT